MAENTQNNPTQSQQNEIAAKSPAKTPAAGGDMPDAKTQGQAFHKAKRQASTSWVGAKDPAPLPTMEHRTEDANSDDPVARANARTVSVDNAGMAASDNTVDTDAKGLEARRDASMWQDNVINSNATLENNVFVPPDGLVDLDSRPGGNVPVVATREGWRVAYHGTVDVPQRDGTRAEQVFTLERTGNGYSHG
ncbi:DUF3005 domain-containing protein [Trinickia dinghuensis]|uniref:DUF3005 domain-containing protein n=1 Tax=Trinickia dinghuensis TaxID=2291023 RepID=A0A3D8JWQ4_9BURK|nr:DUF3005 domain-containing protein [Trinickia dinghuensis]RDU97573.1 DUF3005 domain-containing protein [Trinickia dinghuensis]